ncbi:MAG TPA: endolytic transglycosylase MltG [Candidatus Marinimicrobia bacterium]|jgi:UPF0755 protein|nr:endolytic transglycosylase MltG [Candidatus Neomarinimicrobiota bacterium]
MSDFIIKRLVGYILTVFVFSSVFFYLLVIYWPQPEQNEPVKVVIEKGSTLNDIASTLYASGIIRGSKPFVLATRMMGYETDIKAGTFHLRNAASNHSIIRQLVEGTPVYHKVTIPEGSRLEEIAAVLKSELDIDVAEFLKMCRSSEIAKNLDLPGPTLEGYLFPETYFFTEEITAEEIIGKMTKQYREIMNNETLDLAKERGFSELELVTLASIIEGEAVLDDERKTISAVYHNRLNREMKLQADPTLQFIHGDGPKRLSNKDKKIDSPYNTYLYEGLPPGPINSPGEASVWAALNPADVDYLFFVAKGDDSHVFSRTAKEHLNAKREFDKIRRQVSRERQKRGKGIN